MDNASGEVIANFSSRRSFYSRVGNVCLSVAGAAGVGEFVVHTLPEAVAVGGVAILGLVGSSFSNRRLIDIDHQLSQTNN